MPALEQQAEQQLHILSIAPRIQKQHKKQHMMWLGGFGDVLVQIFSDFFISSHHAVFFHANTTK